MLNSNPTVFVDDACRLSFIVKTTYDCNMRCTYCYEGHAPKRKRMDQQTAALLVEKVGSYAGQTGKPVTFLWHGGEPLLAGIDFYKEVARAEKRVSAPFRCEQLVQTNGILLDDNFADFFVDHGFSVGVSLDGPPIINDFQRVIGENKKSSYKQACAAILRMEKRNARMTAFATFTNRTYNYFDEFYNFFRESGIDVKIGHMNELGRACDTEAQPLHLSKGKWSSAMISLFDLWSKDPERQTTIDPLLSITRSLVSGRTFQCYQMNHCWDYFDVFPNGDIAACGHFPQEKHVLGNIHVDTIEKIMRSPLRADYRLARLAVQEICGPCEYKPICNGGCAMSAHTPRALSSGLPYYCEDYKKIFSHIKTALGRGQLSLR